MTEDELTAFSAQIDVAAVRAYRDAVGLKTRDVVLTLGSEVWAEPFSPADAARAPEWFSVLVGQPRAIELGTSAITHNAIHLGEAVTLRSLAGLAVS
jgi:hypothetical protein